MTDVVDEVKGYEDMWRRRGCVRRRNIGKDSEAQELLSGLCPSCYQRAGECKCRERKAISAVNRSGGRGAEA